jgi:hypothetical protein
MSRQSHLSAQDMCGGLADNAISTRGLVRLTPLGMGRNDGPE